MRLARVFRSVYTVAGMVGGAMIALARWESAAVLLSMALILAAWTVGLVWPEEGGG